MPSDINPALTPTKSLVNFRFWCQKVLPLVYDDSLSYYEVLGKMVVQLNDVIDNVNTDSENVLTLKDAFLALQDYVNNFFADIDQLATYAERAEVAQTAANQSAINAASSASNASASSLAAMNAKDAAVTAKEAAETSANTASTASANATTKASEAAQSAITAQTAQVSASQSATLAATDRSAAQTAASTATSKANEANASAANAAESANNAAESEDNTETLVNTVRESIDAIQQNTQDINEIKAEIADNSYSLTDVFCILNPCDGETTYSGRGIIKKKNKITLSRIVGSTESIAIALTGQNLIAKSESNVDQITPTIDTIIDKSQIAGITSIALFKETRAIGNRIGVVTCDANLSNVKNYSVASAEHRIIKLDLRTALNDENTKIGIYLWNNNTANVGNFYYFFDAIPLDAIALSI